MATRKKTRLQELEEAARRVGLYVDTYSPGDGVTRYRFITRPDRDYFSASGSEKVYTALGLKEAYTFLAGRGAYRTRKFIQGAIEHPGALHRQLHIPAGEKIPVSTLRSAAKKPGKLGQRARLALVLRGVSQHEGAAKRSAAAKKGWATRRRRGH